MDERIEEILIDETAIRRRLRELAEELTQIYLDHHLTIVAVLNGSIVFLADLIRLLPIPLRVEVVKASSYGSGMVSSGVVRIDELGDLRAAATGKHVLLIDDILDTGRTLSKIHQRLASYGPASLRTCVFLNKRARRAAPFEADFCGFEIEDRFVVGYGLDFDGEWRNLPYVAVLRGDAAQSESEATDRA